MSVICTMHEADREAGVEGAAVSLLQRRPWRRIQQVARPVRPRVWRQILRLRSLVVISQSSTVCSAVTGHHAKQPRQNTSGGDLYT